jgi:hypothetical protein
VQYYLFIETGQLPGFNYKRYCYASEDTSADGTLLVAQIKNGVNPLSIPYTPELSTPSYMAASFPIVDHMCAKECTRVEASTVGGSDGWVNPE